jgi:hypothetical protein
MLDVATMVDPILHHRDRRWGQDPDHWQSLHGDSSSTITPLMESDQGRDDGELHNVIRNRDACNQIESWRQQ